MFRTSWLSFEKEPTVATTRAQKDARRSRLVRNYGPDGTRCYSHKWQHTDATSMPVTRAKEVTRTTIPEQIREVRDAEKNGASATKGSGFGRQAAVRKYKGRKRHGKTAQKARERVRAFVSA